MKKLLALSLIGCIIMLSSCELQTNISGEFNILPYPQEIEFTGQSALEFDDVLYFYFDSELSLPQTGDVLRRIERLNDKSEAQIICILDESADLPSEGYYLNITKKQIELTAKDKAGLLYAFMSLDQLLEDAREQDIPLPKCTIKDYPELAYRAIHLDIKHHLERTEYYYDLINKLAKYKVNGIIAEMEDKIQYERRPAVGSADALSIDEWKKLCDYAQERNIEISPLIQGLGHASFVLKHEEYKDLRDDPTNDWAFNPLDPKTYDLQFDLYLDAIEATPHGKYLHVGGDEVHTTGRGSGKSALELQLIWLDKVCKFAEEQGRIPIFWDDMPLKHAGVYRPMFNTELTEKEVDSIWAENEHKLVEFLDRFPKNCIYMRWNYRAAEAVGNAKAMEWFRSKGLQVMGATAGQTRWVLMPQSESNMNNIRAFAKSSIESGLSGLLLTLWDDDSPHFELYKRGIIAFAEYTWAGDRRSKEEIKAAYRHREFSSTLSGEEYAFVDQLEGPVAFYKNALLTGNLRNYLVKRDNAIEKALIILPDEKQKGKWTEMHEKRLEKALLTSQTCDSVAQKIAIMKSHAIRNIYTLEVYEQVNKLAQFTPKILLALKDYDMAESKEDEATALKHIRHLPDEFLELRKTLEAVYSKTRILNKPDNYILDQDHHSHLANQTRSFDWQFQAEILFMEKLKSNLQNNRITE